MTSPHPTAGTAPEADPTPATATPPRLAVTYTQADAAELLARDDTLALIGFGSGAPVLDDPRYLRVTLAPHGAAPLELWRASGPIRHGRDGDIAWAEDGRLQFGAVELDEPALATDESHHGGADATNHGPAGDGDIERISEAAYRRLGAFVAQRGYPHLLRVWNYLDAITAGDGDAERYRRFCVGRARAIGAIDPTTLPAATAIGRVEASPVEASPVETRRIDPPARPRRLQVYWLASRTPGTPLENPRQVSAYRYPRQYGPQAPGFARAMLPPAGTAMPLLLSGTAAIVGHESQHRDSVEAQLDEVLANLDSLIGRARAQGADLPAQLGAGSCLKVYVRDRDELPVVTALLARKLPAAVPRLVLHAAVCRRELRVEIDGVHGA